MAHCMQTLLESKEDEEEDENEDVYRNDLYGGQFLEEKDVTRRGLSLQHDSDNEKEEKSTFLSHLMELVVGTPDMVKKRQDYCEIHDHLMQHRNLRVHYTGSKAEGLDLPGSDDDFMFENPSILVIQEHVHDESLSEYEVNVFIMETEQVKPCFTLLRYTGGRVFNVVSECLKRIGNHIYLSSHLIVHSLKGVMSDSCVVIQGPSLESYSEYWAASEGTDYVYCMKCDFWPLQANEWLHRHRPSGWPSDRIIQKIRGQGCHLVGVGHPLSDRKDMEWRLSFSIAERELVWTFNHLQIQCYAFLKILLKEYIKPRMKENILCSYFVKTIMFWEIESQLSLFWTRGNLTTCLTYLIGILYEHVLSGHLRHYFIPEFNLFEIKVKGEAQEKLRDIMKTLLTLDIFSIMGQCKSLALVCKLYRQSKNSNSQTERELKRKLEYISLECNMSLIETITIIVHNSGNSSEILSRCRLHHTLNRNNTYFEHTIEYGIIVLTKCMLSNSSFSRISNKSLYKTYRLSLYNRIRHDMLLRKVCISIWLFLNRNWAKCKDLILNALSSIPPNYAYMSKLDIKNKDQLAICADFTGKDDALDRRSQRYCIFDIVINKEDINIVPAAIQVELVYSDAISISPFLYLYYLLFLCYHGLHDYPNRDRALRNLIETAKSDEQGGALETRYHSYNISGHCLWFLGRYSEARDMFIKSVGLTMETPVDKNNSAWHYLDMISSHV